MAVSTASHPDTEVLSGGRRSGLEVMTDLLYAAREQSRKGLQTDGGVAVNKRQLMRSANINHTQLTDYLDTLDGKGFIRRYEAEDGLHLELTESGEEFLARVEALITLFEE